jgi:hypothetical protein
MQKHDHAGVREGPRLVGHEASESVRLVSADRERKTPDRRNPIHRLLVLGAPRMASIFAGSEAARLLGDARRLPPKGKVVTTVRIESDRFSTDVGVGHG